MGGLPPRCSRTKGTPPLRSHSRASPRLHRWCVGSNGPRQPRRLSRRVAHLFVRGFSGLQLLDDGPTPGVDEDVVSVAVVTGHRVIAVRVALDVHDCIARLSLQRNHGLHVLRERRSLGQADAADRNGRQRKDQSSNQYARAHDGSSMEGQILENFSGSVSTPQMASRDDAMAEASEGSPSCSSDSTFSSSPSYCWRSCDSGGACLR